MKQVFCRSQGFKTLIFMVLALLFGCAEPREPNEGARIYTIIGREIKGMGAESLEWDRGRFETLGTEEISSAYFDKALGYEGSRFRVVSFSKLVRRLDPAGLSDAVILNGFDDYQGILSIEDIERHHIRLATRIEIRPEFTRPGWLNPLLLIVPDDGGDVPFQERYLTANIRELQFTNLEAYYAPLEKVAGLSTQPGFSSFKDNCLFCHSLMGVGGNKGVRLPEKYDFSRSDGKERFRMDFAAFHHKDNLDKQNVEQFVSKSQLEDILDFLGRVKDPRADAPSP